MSDYYWYGAADRTYRGNDAYLGNACWTAPYYVSGQKKVGVQFRRGPPRTSSFREMWSENFDDDTWHFTILKNGDVLQHYSTQAVTKSPNWSDVGWSNSRCLEANCVTVVFEGPFLIKRWLCHPDGEPENEGWFYCNVIDSDLYTSSDPDDVEGSTCYYAGQTNFFNGIPTTQAQVTAAVALCRWLFYSAYMLGKPLEDQNVWGASYWGEAIFDIEPAPVPPVAIPWQWPVTGGYVSQGFWGQAHTYECGHHAALDIAGLSEGTAIYPAAGNHGGRGCWVVDKGYHSTYGHWVRLRHSHSWDYEAYDLPRIDTVYAHMREGTHVTPGQWITMSDRIGSVGQTGLGGVHLHLGVYEWPDNNAYDNDATNFQANLLGDAGAATMIAGCTYRKDPVSGRYLPQG